MKRRKQFVALSLAAILAWGGVFSSADPLSSVHAEEAQTELPTGQTMDEPTNPSAYAEMSQTSSTSGGDGSVSGNIASLFARSAEMDGGALDFSAIKNDAGKVPAGVYGNNVVSVTFTSTALLK